MRQVFRGRKSFFAAVAGLATVMAPIAATAQDYPGKPITWIAPSSPGGGFDIISRLLAPKLSELLAGC